MRRQKAAPPGYMGTGAVARKMGVTVRTLQHYDRVGLLSPSAVSEGGRRLYTDKDIIKLHQILSLKQLGFSLSDIQNRLIPLDDPGAVAGVLAGQAGALRAQIARLTESLRQIEALRGEVMQMQTVDFKKYADIIVNLQMNNDFYWLIKYFDEETLDHIRLRFDKNSGAAFMETFTRLTDEAIRLQAAGVAPGSEQGRAFAEEYWKMIDEFTGGNVAMLPRLVKLGQFESADSAWRERQAQANAFIGPALEAWFAKQGINPFLEEDT